MPKTDLPTPTQTLSALLEEVLDQGFELPLYTVALGCNGAMTYQRYVVAADGLECEQLAEYFDEPLFAFPANIIVTDSRGGAAKLHISPKEGHDQTMVRTHIKLAKRTQH